MKRIVEGKKSAQWVIPDHRRGKQGEMRNEEEEGFG